MPFTWNILTLFFRRFSVEQTRASRWNPVLFHVSARDSRDWSSHKTRSRWSANKIRSAERLEFAAWLSAALRREIRGVNGDETMTIGRESERRSLARRRRRAPRGRKLVSCFVAKVKTVTLLSALHVAALLVCERTNAGAGQAELKHRRGWPPLARPQLHPIKHDWDTVRPLFSHTGPYKRVPRRLTRRPSFSCIPRLGRGTRARVRREERKNAPELYRGAIFRSRILESIDEAAMRTTEVALKSDPRYANSCLLENELCIFMKA